MSQRSPLKREARFAKIRANARKWRDDDTDIPDKKWHISEKSLKIIENRGERPGPPIWDEDGCLITYHKKPFSRTPVCPRRNVWDASPRVIHRTAGELGTPRRPPPESVSHLERSFSRDRLYRAGRPVIQEPPKKVQSRAEFEDFLMRQSDFSKMKVRQPRLRRSQSVMSFMSRGSAVILQKTQRESSLYDLPSPKKVTYTEPVKAQTPRAKRGSLRLAKMDFRQDRERVEAKRAQIKADSLVGKVDECTFHPKVNKRVPASSRRWTDENIGEERKRIKKKADEMNEAFEELELLKRDYPRPLPEFIKTISEEMSLLKDEEEEPKGTMRRRRHSFAG